MKAKPVGGGADKDIFYKNYTNANGERYQITGNMRTGKAQVRSQSPSYGKAKYEARNETYAEQAARRNKAGSEGSKKPAGPLKKSTTRRTGPSADAMAGDAAKKAAAKKKVTSKKK